MMQMEWQNSGDPDQITPSLPYLFGYKEWFSPL